MKISLIISTYNRPEALRLSLMSAKVQTRIPDEVIIADDGSKENTRELIKNFAKDFPCPILHAWQEDKGFRLAESRNNALRMVSHILDKKPLPQASLLWQRCQYGYVV